MAAEAAALETKTLWLVLAINAAMFAGETRGATAHTGAARMSGYLQMCLAAGALFEVARRAIVGSEPEAPTMVAVAALALAANVTCMWLLARHREGAAHMKASWIFTTNDVIANIGVIIAAGLISATGSSIPDLIVGAVIGFVVLSGAIRILRLPRS